MNIRAYIDRKHSRVGGHEGRALRSSVKRHPESTPRRHEELTPFCLLRLWLELMSFSPILLLLQLAFAEDRYASLEYTEAGGLRTYLKITDRD